MAYICNYNHGQHLLTIPKTQGRARIRLYSVWPTRIKIYHTLETQYLVAITTGLVTGSIALKNFSFVILLR